jgi:hypothetical protein
MLDSTRNIGGPDVPPLTKREQIDLLYDALKIPLSQRRAISIPVALLSGFIGAAAVAARFFGAVGAQDLRGKAADIAEVGILSHMIFSILLPVLQMSHFTFSL